jgi:hypothetical protein
MTQVTVDEDFIAVAEGKMNAVIRIVREQPDRAKEARALVILKDMWASIEDDLKAATAAREKMCEVAVRDRDLAAMVPLVDKRLCDAARKYHEASEAFFTKLITEGHEEEWAAMSSKQRKELIRRARYRVLSEDQEGERP